MGEQRDVHQVKTDRRHGVALLAGVCLVAIIVLTIAQASIGHWFVYSAVSNRVGGAFAGTEWGMVALGILLGASLALMVAYTYYRVYEHIYGGVNRNVYADLESGKAKFLSVKTTEHERDYVARYGQKAYQMDSGDQMVSMPQPLTPGHTSTLKIKALPEQDMPSPGRGWSLGRLLSYSWDSAKPQSFASQPEHAQPSRLGGAGLSGAQSTASSIVPVHEPSLPPSTRAPTYTELANQISSPFGFLRAGSAIPVAHDHHGQPDAQAASDTHQHQAEGGQSGTPRKGAGLLGHIYNRKLEQAQQVQAAKTKLAGNSAPAPEGTVSANPRIMVLRESGDVEVQAAKTKLAGSSAPAQEGTVSANPRIMVLRESGDVEVNVELGDHENTADGSFMRTTMHRRRRTSSVSEAGEEVMDAAKGSQNTKSAVAAKDNASQDGHAPEVVPADATAKKITSSGTTNKDTQSKMEHKYKAKSGDASADAGFVQQDSNRDKAKRSTGSPLFLSPATSLNSNSSGLSRHSSGGRADFDSLAAATTAVASAAAAPVKPAAKPVLLSSAALQKMDSNHNSAKFGKKAASVKSAKSVKSDNHSRTSSVDWQDVELQSEGEGKAPAHPMGVQGRPRGVPSHLGAKGTANAALRGAETETDDGLSEAEGGGGRQGQRAGLPELPSTDGQLRAVALADLGKEAQEVRLVVCISLEQILPRPQAGLLSRMLRLADVPLVKGADGLEPVYVVQPGGEYRIGVGLFQIPGARKLQLQGASWLRIALPQGNSVTLPLDQDEDSDIGDWSGNATWLLSQDHGKAFALDQQAGSGMMPVEVTLGLQTLGKTSKRGRRHRSQEMQLPFTLKLKVISRGNEAQSVLDMIDTYTPSGELLSFWKTWNRSADDIQDCVVICVK